MLIQQQGAGLVETLITLLVIAMGVIALVRFQNNLIYSDDISQQKSKALILATNQIETLRDYSTITGYNEIVSGSSTVSGNPTYNTTYNINWTITTVANPSYKTINVTVSWTDRQGTAQQIQQVTLLAGLDPALSAGAM